MAAGTPTLGDSYNLSLSAVFKGRVQSALLSTCTAINSEAISTTMPLALHLARKGMVAAILNPANFNNWLTQFVMLASVDATVIADATLSASNYTPITSQSVGDSAAAEGGNIPDSAISNAVSAAFNAIIPGV